MRQVARPERGPRETPAGPGQEAGRPRADVLALQRRAGNRAVGAWLARRTPDPVTVELRRPPPWQKPDPASLRATPENRELAAEIDALDALGDDELITRRREVTGKLPFAIGTESERLTRTQQALEYVLDQRARQARYEGAKARADSVGPPVPDWKRWPYVRNDPAKRFAMVRAFVEGLVREQGSFDDAIDSITETSEIEAELAALRREAKQFAGEFAIQAQRNAERLIDGSLKAVDEVLTSYGVPVPVANAVAQEMYNTEEGVPGFHVTTADAAKTVVTSMKLGAGTAEVNAPAKERKREALSHAAARIRSLQIKVGEMEHAMWQAATPPAGQKIDWADAAKRKAAFVAARGELTNAWFATEKEHPVLAAFRRGLGPDKGTTTSGFAKLELGDLGSTSVDKEMTTLLVRVLPTLMHVGRARKLIKDRAISPLTLPSVVALTQANMFVPEGSLRAGVVHDLVRTARKDREGWLVQVFAFALALVTFLPTGGASLAVAGLASASLAAYSSLRELDRYELHKVLADTDLDRARALVRDDPSLAGFVTSLIALGLEGLPLLHAIATVKQLRLAVRSGDDTTRLIADLNRLTRDSELGEQALADARAAERNAAKSGTEPPPKAPHEPAAPGPVLRPGAKPPPLPDKFMGYRYKREVSDAMRNALRGETQIKGLKTPIRSGMAADALPEDWPRIAEALAHATPADAARAVADLMPVVQRSLRDPDLYAEVLADAWERARTAYLAGNPRHTVYDALIDMAKERGKVAVIKQNTSLRAKQFYDRYGGQAVYWIDNPLATVEHGAVTHLLQDLVVDRGLARAGKRLTSPEFRAQLGRLRGTLRRAEFDTFEAMTFLKQGELGAAATEKELSVGDYIWRLTYDLFQRSGEPRHINQPEAIGAIITKLIFSPY